jgi:hypothetical protein
VCGVEVDHELAAVVGDQLIHGPEALPDSVPPEPAQNLVCASNPTAGDRLVPAQVGAQRPPADRGVTSGMIAA